MKKTYSTAPAAAILAVGTELTTGQITNRNAAWISEKLVNLGIEVLLHETVPDDRKLILDALNRCGKICSLIFVTGGLGPTTDDFTREIIAEWLHKPLEFNNSVWDKMSQRLKDFGISVVESNRQQCFFPAGSDILPNPAGTAAGFTAAFSDKSNESQPEGRVWVFPGPPNELSKVWEQGVESNIRKIHPNLQPLRLFTWQCMGKSEAELGEITEKALYGSGLKTGYRAHRFSVEIKVWCEEHQIPEKNHWLIKLEEALSPWIITKQGDDLAVRLLKALQRDEPIEVIDSVSGGILSDRLGPLLRDPKFQIQAEALTLATEWTMPSVPEEWLSRVLEQADEESITLVLGGFSSDGKGVIGLREGPRVYEETIQPPYLHPERRPEFLDRMRYYIVEHALKRWCEWLDSSTT